MPRRPNPKPTPYRNADGRITYRVRFRHRGTETSRTFDTKREAGDFCADVRDFGADDALRRLAERDSPRRTGPTLDEVFAQFLTWTAANVRSSRTPEDYARDYRKAIKPTFGARTIASITDDEVQLWVDGLKTGDVAPRIIRGERQPLAAKTICDRHALLSTVMDYAVRPPRRLIPVNPCQHTTLPKKRKRPPVAIRPAEWQALHAALEQRSPDAADLALALQSTGARFSEVIALSTYDVDDRGDDTLDLIIAHVIRREANSKSVRVDDTKTDAGFRRVKVDPACANMIRRRLNATPAGDYVFRTARGGRWHYNNFRSREWLPACDLVRLDPRPKIHGLRHLHVAELIRAGATLAQIRVRLGHENFMTTFNTYGMLIEEVDGDVLTRFAARRDGVGIAAGPVIAGELASASHQ